MLPSPKEQKRLAGPAIQDGLNRDWSYRTLGIVMGVKEQTLKDIHEGRGTKDLVEWQSIQVHLK